MIKCFSFGDALIYLKAGRKVKRLGWNGKDQYIELGNDIIFKKPDGTIILAGHDAMKHSAIVFYGTSGVQVGWLASQADILAEDWVLAK